MFVGAAYQSGGFKSYLVRVDQDGDPLWTRVYGGSQWETGNGVEQTSDGGFIVSGGKHRYGSGTSDVHLMRTDALGDTMWTHTYWRGGVMAEDTANSIIITTDGDYVIAGESEHGSGDNADVWLLKIRDNGQVARVDPSRAGYPGLQLRISPLFTDPLVGLMHAHFEIPVPAEATLTVHDVSGRQVETLIAGRVPAGKHTITWDASRHSAGVFFFRLATGNRVIGRKATVLR